jgi:hypothetical protein
VNVVAAVVIAVIALAIVGIVFYAIRSAGQAASARADAPTGAPPRPMPQVSDFHVKGDTASVVFSVPLGDEDAGAHLTELLGASAVEYVRQKVADGLPLEGVRHISVSAMRDGQPAYLDTVDLPDVGQLPEEAEILRRDPSSHDPIAAVAAVAADSSVAAPAGRSDTLEPVAQLVELSGPTEAHLRAVGVDTSAMDLDDLVLGLFRVSGYTVDTNRQGIAAVKSAEGANTYWVNRSGVSSLVMVVSHEPGTYPELDDQVLSEFAVGVAQLNPSQAMLITDKFGPYSMYERERRDKRTIFVTRERLQGFADSFGLS